MGSIPGQGTKIQNAVWGGKKKNNLYLNVDLKKKSYVGQSRE